MRDWLRGLTLIKVAELASVLGVGVLAGFLYSVKHVNPALEIRVGGGSVVAFVMGGALAYLFWRAVAAGVRRALMFGLVLTLATAGAFVYALKDLRSERAFEVASGVTLALMVLGFFGLVVVFIGRYLEEDDRRNAVPGEEPTAADDPPPNRDSP